ncbi:hypothetical protein HDU92_004814 [Lobulomyces angularis]|nr:hypothetical protein HDU92_004814 [Lobulomyces angularis]
MKISHIKEDLAIHTKDLNKNEKEEKMDEDLINHVFDIENDPIKTSKSLILKFNKFKKIKKKNEIETENLLSEMSNDVEYLLKGLKDY